MWPPVVVVVACLAVVLVVAGILVLFRSRQRELRRLRFLGRTEADLLRDYLADQNSDWPTDPGEYPYLRDAVVMVVGAGGSIASVLVAGLAAMECRSVVLVDNNEDGLYALRRRLERDEPKLAATVHTELANVRDAARLTALFNTYRPDVVFHYANYKSAALGNSSPYAFVLVNIGGTRNLLDVIARSPSVREFVYISSDKAQCATQTYGHTKRVAELLVQSHAQTNSRVHYVCVRYCNVLDAAGSFAIPTFRGQISTRHDVTVRRLLDGTIPDRYFITIEMAVRLALAAAGVATSGVILSLDSRRVQAIRMDDLVRILAREYGVRDVDRWFRRNVVFVDAEDGEKASESLGTGTALEGAPLVALPQPPLLDADGICDAVRTLLMETADQQVDHLPEQMAAIVARYGSGVEVPAPPATVISLDNLEEDLRHAAQPRRG